MYKHSTAYVLTLWLTATEYTGNTCKFWVDLTDLHICAQTSLSHTHTRRHTLMLSISTHAKVILHFDPQTCLTALTAGLT